MLNKLFHHIYLINLPHRRIKLEQSLVELGKYGLTPVVVEAISDDNGAYGLYQTMRQLFSRPEIKDWETVLVFEDDIKFVCNPVPVLEKCLAALNSMDWDLFYLGPNTHQSFQQPVNDCLLQLYNAYSTHAIAWSPSGRAQFMNFYWRGRAIDVMISEDIQTKGKSYCSLDFVATQRNGYSDIDKKEVSYDYIEQRFRNHTSHIVKNRL